MIIAGDVGGTKTVLALCNTELAIVREAVYACADYPSLEAIVDEFLAPSERAVVTAACIGVAGPVIDGAAKLTNLAWTIDARVLSHKLDDVPVSLINDLQATALGMLVLPPSAFAVLQAGRPASHGTIAVIAPGTGLGHAILVSDGERYRALPTEAGHIDFAPSTDEEIELLRHLRGLYGHVSYERVLSGVGFGDVYDFVRGQSGVAEPAWLTAELAADDRNAAISRIALEGRDPACVRTLELFVDLLGAEAGNSALRVLATGVVIGGGISPKILPALQRGRLVERFCDKGRFTAWMQQRELRVALEPRAALFGAAHHAASLVRAAGRGAR